MNPSQEYAKSCTDKGLLHEYAETIIVTSKLLSEKRVIKSYLNTYFADEEIYKNEILLRMKNKSERSDKGK